MWKGALVLTVVAVGVGAMVPALTNLPPLDAAPHAAPLVVDRANVAASPSPPTLGGTISLPRGPGGHFYATADVNGSGIDFVVDTGATVVSLSRADAERAGITIDPARFEVVGQGASGPVMGIAVVLRDVELGGHRVSDLPAVVLADSPTSLLGQNFLSRFQSVSIENDEMMLR